MKKILVVDDEPTTLLALSYLLGNEDTAVITSSCMKEAEDALGCCSFDLAIVDIRFSGIEGKEGLELLNYIKRQSPATDVIIMTACGTDEIEEEAYRRGAFYFYEKPIDIVELISQIQSHSKIYEQLSA